MGRIVRFKDPQPLPIIIERIAHGVGSPKGFPIAIPQGSTVDSLQVRAIAICAGSGGSLFSDLPPDVDLLFTGELSHHEALAATEAGKVVIALFHSNSERGFLHAVLKEQLKNKLKDEWTRVRHEEKSHEESSRKLSEILEDESVSVDISEKDRDPYGILVAKSEI